VPYTRSGERIQLEEARLRFPRDGLFSSERLFCLPLVK
jgi:hypothetical protein